MSSFSFKDYLKTKNNPTGNIDGEEINELMRLKQEYQKNPSVTKRMLLESKQKRLAKKGLKIKI